MGVLSKNSYFAGLKHDNNGTGSSTNFIISIKIDTPLRMVTKSINNFPGKSIKLAALLLIKNFQYLYFKEKI